MNAIGTMVFGISFLLSILVGCATPPPAALDEEARQLGFQRFVLQGTDYRHVAYRNQAQGRLLHVYLDGDGTPWVSRHAIAADPTPRNPLVLSLMAQDSAPSLYLGRPCYHGFSSDPPCTPLLWTSRRYGPEVVDSMVAALKRFLAATGYRDLVFIGYSGGGALAMLLAEGVDETRGVLTVAGNLDPDRWAAWHGYAPLVGSLNPVERAPLRPDIVQVHFLGGKDENIPHFFAKALQGQSVSTKLILKDNFDHFCCWEATWPSILKELNIALRR